jgi:hypothetical protein
MALHDRFNRPGDHWLTRLDVYITWQAGRFADWLAAFTRFDRHTLVQGLLVASACASLERVFILHDVLYLAIAFLAMQGLGRSFGPQFGDGGLREEIRYEAVGLPRWVGSAVNVLFLFCGLMALADVTGYLLSAPLTAHIPVAPFFDSLLSGVAFTGWKGAEYIARTNSTGTHGGPRRSQG